MTTACPGATAVCGSSKVTRDAIVVAAESIAAGASRWRWRMRAVTRVPCRRLNPGNPVDARRGEFACARAPPRADGHRVLGRVDPHDVERDRGGEAQALALADGEAMDAAVRSDDPCRSRRGSRRRRQRVRALRGTTRARPTRQSRSRGCPACRRPTARARARSSRTAVLSRSPTGNIACASCSWVSVKRKYDWSLAGSVPRFST